MIECRNRKVVREHSVCCVREDFDEGVAYCQFVGKEYQCPQYNEDIGGCKVTEVEKYEYLHDGVLNKVEIHKLDYKDGLYRFEIRIDDANDCQRLIEHIKYDLGILGY